MNKNNEEKTMMGYTNRSPRGKFHVFLAGLFILSAAAAESAADIGTELWNTTYYSPNGFRDASFEGIRFSPDGNIFVSGFRAEPDSGNAVAVRLDSATGNILDTPSEWILYDDTWSDYVHDRFYSSFQSSTGDIYFAGTSDDPDRANNFGTRLQMPTVWKYSAAGDLQWKKVHTDNPGVNNGYYYDISGDSSDSIFAAGYFENHVSAGSAKDWMIYKYDSSDNVASGFPVAYDHDGLDDIANGIATDSQGNIIVVGSVKVSTPAVHANWHVRKYDSSGSLLWFADYDFNGVNSVAQYVYVDGENNVYVCGYRTSPTADTDWYMVKYAADSDPATGEPVVLWEQFWDDGNSLSGVAWGVTGDPQGNIYIVGSQIDSTVGNQYRPWLQYRNGQTGDLLTEQEISHTVTTNAVPNSEHDYIKRLALQGGQLVASGSTFQGYSINYGRTARVAMIGIDTVEVTTVINGEGTVSPAGPISIRADTPGQTSLKLTPAGYSIVEIEGSCPVGTLTAQLDGTYDYSTGTITAACDVVVNFVPRPAGDVSGNGTLGLEDVIQILKVISGE